MTKAKDGLVERIVVGPKPIHTVDPKTGERYKAEIGDTVFLSAKTAKAFDRYLKSPEVAKAEAAVKAAEEKATGGSAEVAEEAPKEALSGSKGGGSDEP